MQPDWARQEPSGTGHDFRSIVKSKRKIFFPFLAWSACRNEVSSNLKIGLKQFHGKRVWSRLWNGIIKPVQLGVPRAAHFEVEPPANSPWTRASGTLHKTIAHLLSSLFTGACACIDTNTDVQYRSNVWGYLLISALNSMLTCFMK